MKKSVSLLTFFIVMILGLSTVFANSFSLSNSDIQTEEEEINAVEVKALEEQQELFKQIEVTKDLENRSIVPLQAHTQLDFLKAPRKNANKVPGGDAVEVWYPTNNGEEVMVAQSYDPFTVEESISYWKEREQHKKLKELKINGKRALLSEVEGEGVNHLYIFTKDTFISIAGVIESDKLLEIGKLVK